MQHTDQLGYVGHVAPSVSGLKLKTPPTPPT